MQDILSVSSAVGFVEVDMCLLIYRQQPALFHASEMIVGTPENAF